MSKIANVLSNVKTAGDVFNSFTTLKEYVAVYVPSTVERDKPIDNSSFSEVVMKTMSSVFGGCTAYDAIGSWTDDNGTLITENVTVCKSYTDFVTGDMAESIVKLANMLKRIMTQDCISIEYNGRLMFV